MSKEDWTWTGLKKSCSRRAALRGVATLTAGAVGVVTVGCDNEGKKPSGATSTSTPENLVENFRALYDKTHYIAFNYVELRQTFSQEEIRQQAKDLTILKARLIEKAYLRLKLDGEQQEVKVEKRDDRDIVIIRGQEFDVRYSSCDFFIGAALVDYLFEEQFDHFLKEAPGFESDRQTLPDSNIENLLWLADHLEEVELGDVSPITRTSGLDTLGRALRVLEESGLSIPKKVKIDQFSFEEGENPHKDENPDTILLEAADFGGFNSARPVASFLAARKPNMVGDYLEVVSRTYRSQRQPTETEFFNPKGEVDFINAFEGYMFHGVRFRKRIAYAKIQGLEAEEVMLRVRYDFLKKVLGGREFSINSQIKPVVSYKVGDDLRINDYERPDNSGIILRQRPTLEIDPNWPYINHDAFVQIIDGSQVLLDHEKRQATTMWRVQRGEIGMHGFEGYGLPGWVSEEWFGPPKIEQ